MKKFISFFVSLCTIIGIVFIGGCKNKSSTQDTYFYVTYMASVGGLISGDAFQDIKAGESSTPVEAIPYEGYRFYMWSDGRTESIRSDMNVQGNIHVTAQFFKISKTESTFTLDFRTADTFDIEQTITIKNSELFGTQLPVPSKEHFTFNGWYIRGQDKSKCITDANGVINKYGVDLDSSVLLPSWTANETFTYKILMVYVTEIHAVLPTRIIAENRTREVDYVMTEEERQFCHITTQQLKAYLDDMMDGLVEFVVDEYFTTQPVTTESFSYGYGIDYGEATRSPSLFADRIPEVNTIIGEYDGVVSSVSYNCFEDDFFNYSGHAKTKFCEVFFDRGPLYNMKINGIKIREVIENPEQHRVVESWLETIVHELAHTIELRVNSYDYHKCISELGWNQRVIGGRYIQKLYFTGSVIMEGKKVGINYSFWSGTTLTVRYECTKGGYVNFKEQEVLYGGDTLTAFATAYEGYRFVKWSDGVTDISRTERNVTEDITLTAIFEKIT